MQLGRRITTRVRERVRRSARADRGPERNPDERHPLETLDDWILFGPRLR
ncbi:MAG TPA: hypothetical protein VF235_03510 [Actinomycetota bacterium]